MYYEKQKGVVIDCDVCLFLNKQKTSFKKSAQKFKWESFSEAWWGLEDCQDKIVFSLNFETKN